jgi:hypothetical protein
MTDLKSYRAHEGVETVDGRRVPEDRILRLTDAQARFDLDAGKIAPLDQVKSAPAKAGPAAAEVPAKGKLPADG